MYRTNRTSFSGGPGSRLCRTSLSHAQGGVCDINWRWGVTPIHSAMLLYPRCLLATTRPDRAAPEVRGRTEATPLLLPLVRHSKGGGVTGSVATPTPPFWGVAPVQLIPAGRLGKAHRRRRYRAGERPDEMASSGPAFRGPVRVRLGLPLPAFPPCPGRGIARRRSGGSGSSPDPGALIVWECFRVGRFFPSTTAPSWSSVKSITRWRPARSGRPRRSRRPRPH